MREIKSENVGQRQGYWENKNQRKIETNEIKWNEPYDPYNDVVDGGGGDGMLEYVQK